MKAVVFSLGCKVNQCEGQSMISAFEAMGVAATDKLEAADIFVINTCSITAEADRKSRQAVSRALALNGDAKIYVCGCSSQRDSSAFADKPNVRIVTGVANKSEAVRGIVEDAQKSDHAADIAVEELPRSYCEERLPRHTKTRSYVKIQDGCNNFCSYCIVPYLRGRSRSRSVISVLEEAREAAKHTHEIVLTGIDVSSYGRDIGSNLSSLMRVLGEIPVRKRLSSLECTVIDEELLTAMRDGGFCDHFHLSLQSGSDGVLRRMNRKYTAGYFLEKVELIRRFFPKAGITTDVITGFGGETEEEFRETEAFVQKVGFADMHVFPYSERKGTKACSLAQIDKSIRKARAQELIKVAAQMKCEFYRGSLGGVAEVYAETRERGESVGYTSNYVKVYSDLPIGKMGKVILKELRADGVKGEIYG